MKLTCVRNEKYFTKYVEKVKDIEWEEESKDVSHSGLRADNESINESETVQVYSLVVQMRM